MNTEIILAISTVFLAAFILVLAIFTYYFWFEAKKQENTIVD
jgi:preprotein translocase subunit SecG